MLEEMFRDVHILDGERMSKENVACMDYEEHLLNIEWHV